MPTLSERIATDFKAAMLARDSFKTELLSGLKAAILNEEVARGVRDTGLDETAIEQVISREVKKRDEAARLFSEGDRPESADKERREAEILKTYLPEQLDEAAIRAIVDDVIAELQPQGIKDMGRVIGAVKAKVGNTADGAIVASLVKSSLQ